MFPPGMQGPEVFLGGAAVGFENFEGLFWQCFGKVWLEALADGFGEVLNIFCHEGALVFDEVFGEGLEVFHMGAEDEGFLGEDCFGRVLAAGGEEGFSDDDDICKGCPRG